MMLPILVLDIESKLQEQRWDLFGQDHLILPRAIPSPSLYILFLFFNFKSSPFLTRILYLFIYGCVGSSFLCEGFL